MPANRLKAGTYVIPRPTKKECELRLSPGVALVIPRAKLGCELIVGADGSLEVKQTKAGTKAGGKKR